MRGEGETRCLVGGSCQQCAEGVKVLVKRRARPARLKLRERKGGGGRGEEKVYKGQLNSYKGSS